jgi:CRISPR-associated protein Csx10
MPNDPVWIFFELPLTISVEAPLHIGTGYDRGLIQRTVMRDAQGNVYIPGSSLKGKARNACEDLARCCGLPVCGLPRVAEAPNGGHHPELCLVCRVFGTPGGNDPTGRGLSWHDARLTTQWQTATTTQDRSKAWPMGQTTVRTQVQLSRARGMAAEDRLYTSEFTAHGLEFVGQVSGWLKAFHSIEKGYYELNLLLAGLRLVETLGGARSRGAGRCRIELPPQVIVRAEGQQEPEQYSTTNLLEAAEWLGLFPEKEETGENGA